MIVPDPRITSYSAARLLGITPQALTRPAMDRILRPIRVGRRRLYSLSRVEAYRAQRDAQAAAERELAWESDYAPIEGDE